ncbi:restriction endonuclease subunit S [Vibrio parahaemolyticus]|nr:restriction endonuclease subunit S [Vibrio parahaemolyticus]
MTSSVKFSEIAELVMGQSPKGADCNETGDGFPLLNGPTEFTERSPLPVQFTTAGKKFSKTGDILFCVRGSTTGRMNYADQAYAIGRGIGAIRGINGYPTAYIRAVLEHNLDRLLVAATGSTFPNVGKDLLNNFEVNVCSPEQAQQANKLLVGIEDKRYLNSQTNQTLEEMAQAIFKSWFVDFDPVKAKMNGDKPEGMDEATASLFPEKLVESELGLIPEGWEAVQIGDIVERLKPKKRYTKKQVEPYGKTPVYEQGASILLGFHNDDAGFDASPEEPVFIFGDHTCITHLSCSKFDISSNVIPLKGSIRPTIWTYYAIQGKQEFQEYRRHWSEFIIKGVVLPPIELAEKYAELVTTNYLMMESLKRQSKELEQLRDTLLPKLLSGEIELGQAQELAEVE